MSDNLPLIKLTDFLKTVPPFHLLSEMLLEELVRTLIIEYFPKGETILNPEGPPTGFLYVIRSGGVKLVFPEKIRPGQERIFDYRDEGEFFGLISLLSDQPSPFRVLAEEDSLCYLIKKEVFKGLLRDHPDLLIYFTRGPSKGYKQWASRPTTVPSPESVEPDMGQVLFTGRVREVMRADLLTCSPEETLIGAARRMADRGVGSIIVVDPTDTPIGIVTDGDFRSKVLASGKLANVSMIDIMSRPVQSVSPEAFCFEAVISMISHGIKYLPVMEGLKLVGIISEHDLMVSQGNNPVAVIKGIGQAASVAQVKTIRKNIDLALKVILEHGGMARDICELISILNDHLTQRIVVLAEEALVQEGRGRPPVSYAWIALGSEGRCEQTLMTDQDNALVFADVLPEREEAVRDYFLALSEKVVSGLEQLGFPRCKGGIMAINPKWCQPFRAWRKYFKHWIVDFDYSAEEILQTFIFFDFRAIYGRFDFAVEIHKAVVGDLNQRKSFLRDMAETAVSHQTPLGFFKSLVVEKSGEHKNQLNLKLYGLTPLI
ncbi:MAG: DUF294 nucleotidyltransferase-like domain-containing protein, partial [Thermodesulfobacteriota bacterium]